MIPLFFTFNWILKWKPTQLAFYLEFVIQLFSEGSPEDLPGFLANIQDPYLKKFKCGFSTHYNTWIANAKLEVFALSAFKAKYVIMY